MQCQQFESLFEQCGDARLPAEASAHLEQCGACRQMVAEFAAIRSAAKELAVVPQEPPERVWLELRSRLRAEGIIRERPEAAPEREGSWAAALSAWLHRPALATAYVALALLAFSVLWTQAPNAPGGTNEGLLADAAGVSRSLDTVENAAVEKLEPEKSSTAQSLKRSLQVIDNFIALCEKTVHEDPHNAAARQFLNGAYQQKADLLATAVEHGWTGE